MSNGSIKELRELESKLRQEFIGLYERQHEETTALVTSPEFLALGVEVKQARFDEHVDQQNRDAIDTLQGAQKRLPYDEQTKNVVLAGLVFLTGTIVAAVPGVAGLALATGLAAHSLLEARKREPESLSAKEKVDVVADSLDVQKIGVPELERPAAVATVVQLALATTTVGRDLVEAISPDEPHPILAAWSEAEARTRPLAERNDVQREQVREALNKEPARMEKLEAKQGKLLAQVRQNLATDSADDTRQKLDRLQEIFSRQRTAQLLQVYQRAAGGREIGLAPEFNRAAAPERAG